MVGGRFISCTDHRAIMRVREQPDCPIANYPLVKHTEEALCFIRLCYLLQEAPEVIRGDRQWA